MSAVRRSAVVPYSAREMYALVADIGAYPEFLPWCGRVRVLRREADVVEAAITIAYRGVHKTFTTRNLLQQDKMMEMRLIEGPFRRLHGYWRFTALEERACKVELDLEFEVANRLLGAVLTPVFNGIVNQLADAFHARAVASYGRRPPGAAAKARSGPAGASVSGMTPSRITVEVVYATPEVQAIETVSLRPGATVAQAVRTAGLLARFPEIDLSRQAVGIHGRRVRPSDPVADGDRVEIYRPLAADPKEMRRRRARSAR